MDKLIGIGIYLGLFAFSYWTTKFMDIDSKGGRAVFIILMITIFCFVLSIFGKHDEQSREAYFVGWVIMVVLAIGNALL